MMRRMLFIGLLFCAFAAVICHCKQAEQNRCVMSAIATFELLPISSIGALKQASVAPAHNLHDFRKQNAREIVQYRWSGWVLSTLLEYLGEERGVDLTRSSFDDLAQHLQATLGTSCFVLTHEHRQLYEAKLNASDYRDDELRDYYNTFNEVDAPDSGRPMLDGVRALRDALRSIDDQSIVLM